MIEHASRAFGSVLRVVGKLSQPSEKWDVAVSLLLGLGLVFWIFVDHLDSDQLWFDETGQVLMSHGLGHFSEFGSKEGGLIEIWKANQSFNLDPGGFTILLHGWCKVAGTSPLALRVLPVAFVFLSLIFCGLIAYETVRKFSVGVLTFLIWFSSAVVLEQSLEVRAYSMEYCGVFFCCYALCALWRQPRGWGWWLMITFSACLFMGSRFSFWPIALGTAVLLFALSIIRQRPVFPVVVFLAGIVLVGLPIYFAIVHGEKATPGYMAQWIIGHPDADRGKVLSDTFLRHEAIMLHALGLIAFLGYCLSLSRKCFEPVVVPIVFASIMLLGFQLMSVIGLHPASFEIRWNISLHALYVISIMGVAGFVYLVVPRVWNRCFGFVEEKYCWPPLAGQQLIGVLIVCLAAMACSSVQRAREKFVPGVHERTVDLLREVVPDATLWLNKQALPTVHYFFRYSGLFDHDQVSIVSERVVPEEEIEDFVSKAKRSQTGDLLLVHNKVFLPEANENWAILTELGPSVLLQRK